MAMGLGGARGLGELPGGLGRRQSKINVTPLIDVLLVLLIIFIMVAPALTMALPSEIPRVADETLPAEYSQGELVVHLSADGMLRLNREPVRPAELPDRLAQIFLHRDGPPVVFLDAERQTPYGAVIELMDLCREGGAQKIGMIPDSLGN